MLTSEKASPDAGANNEKYGKQDQDIEANKPIASPATSTFPGTTYGLNPSDQPSDPPRRVNSLHSLRHDKSAVSLHTDTNAPPLPASHTYPPQNQNTNSDNHHHQPGDTASQTEELAWGPSHPCFPHLNPHVPLTSQSYKTTRIIRIRRDWMIAGDLAPTYSNIYPEILDPLISESEFRFVINHINTTLLDAFDPFSTQNWIDGLLGLLTGWLWEDFHPKMGTKGKLKDLDDWIEKWNVRVGAKEQVRLISLRRTGYMQLDIEIPDPQVKIVDDQDEDEDGEEEDENGEGGTQMRSSGGRADDGFGHHGFGLDGGSLVGTAGSMRR